MTLMREPQSKTIEVDVRLYSPYNDESEEDTLKVRVKEPAKIKTVLQALFEKHQKLGESIPAFEDEESFLREVLLLKGDVIADLSDSVEDGETIHVLPAIVSG